MLLIRSIQFDGDGGVAVEYLEQETDIRENGVMVNHVLFVPGGEEFADDVDDLRDKAVAFLAHVIEVADKVPPMEVPPPDGDEMGYGLPPAPEA